ncbi:efflux RND transporter permease subunit [Kordiimonas pumila]|uniref:Efflux RND transporter permease subunit n=1 Tax=Kordiimonas pumila TaxID=2161677 RepID=A0ABV7D6L4_9PROT|nr:efflux RND transporter permease subunit [Kordiimonas pumila]
MNKTIEWWARNKVAANLLMIGIFLSGVFGFMAMEREVFPTVRFPGLAITVTWPGASPQDVEEQIVSRIEESMQDLDNIDWIRSTSSEGFGQIIVLALRDADFTQFMNDVKIRVDSISSFPRDIEPPIVKQFVQREEFIRVAVYGDVSERELKQTSETLRREVAQLPAISLVETFGTRNEEVSVEVSEDALRRYNLTFSEVSRAIANNSLNSSGGTIETDSGDLTLTARNLADTQHDFENIIIRQTADGGIVRVRDVATVIDGFEDVDLLASLNGKPAVLLQVLSTEKMDVVKASESIHKWIEERSKTLPAGIQMTLWTDQANEFNSRMSTISSSALQGLVLVLIVLLLTLRPKVAFWVTMGIATAYAGAFVFLPALDVSLNMLSTFAFLLVLGIVVDDAIVIGESIHTESQRTGGGITAAVFGAQIVAKPVIYAVLTTIIAFTPWVFMNNESTEFTRHITWVVITALSFSLIESLLILPAHLSKMKPREHVGRFGKFQKKIATSITDFAQYKYRKIGTAAVENKYLTTSIFVFIFMFGFGLFSSGYVKSNFQPSFESEEISINVTMPEGSPYWRALEILQQLQVAEQKLIEQEDQLTGGKSKLVENWYTRARKDSVIAIVKLAPAENRSIGAKEAALKLRDLIGDIPDAKEVSVTYENGNNDPDFELSVRHSDLTILRQAVADLEEKLRTYDALYDIRNNLDAASEEIRISMKPGAEKLGLTLADVSLQVRQAYYGDEVQRLPREGQDVKVKVRYPKETRQSIESLENFRVRTADGNEVPLKTVAELTYAPGIKNIHHWQMYRAARVSADMKDSVRGNIMEDLNKNFFPEWEKKYPGIQRGSIGQAEGEAEFQQQLVNLYLVAIFVMYMLLATAFKSYWQPLAIMVAMPFAFIGAIYGHYVGDMTMSVFSYFGIAAAAGVVVNDNLVLVDFSNKLRERGLNPVEAIVEAGVARFRPILLTSVTTFIGLTPMMLEQSIQAAFLKPVVMSLSAGVVIAFFVTLLLVPALYAIGYDLTILKEHLKIRLLQAVKKDQPKDIPSQAE